MMRATWIDGDGDDVSLSEFNTDGEWTPHLILYVSDNDSFAFTPDDAESFAAYLRAWALKQREGV